MRGSTLALVILVGCAIPACAPPSDRNETDAAESVPEPAPVAPSAQPSPPSDDEIAAAIASSDDFATRREVLVRASRDLISSRRCTLAQLADWGWTRSVNRPGGTTYFTYCGRANVADRIYVDARTGAISR